MAEVDRRSLPQERHGKTVKFVIFAEVGEIDGYFVVNTFEDGTPAELFIYIGKQGHELHGWADSWATLVSLLFQHGVPYEKIYEKIKFLTFEPSGLTNLEPVRFCKSIPDLIGRYLEANYSPTATIEGDGYSAILEEVVS